EEITRHRKALQTGLELDDAAAEGELTAELRDVAVLDVEEIQAAKIPEQPVHALLWTGLGKGQQALHLLGDLEGGSELGRRFARAKGPAMFDELVGVRQRQVDRMERIGGFELVGEIEDLRLLPTTLDANWLWGGSDFCWKLRPADEVLGKVAILEPPPRLEDGDFGSTWLEAPGGVLDARFKRPQVLQVRVRDIVSALVGKIVAETLEEPKAFTRCERHQTGRKFAGPGPA
ncbi:MAG: hypothetical protein GY733_14915, partial [bacterium]|nr:hypothetical protein [bacterium]